MRMMRAGRLAAAAITYGWLALAAFTPAWAQSYPAPTFAGVSVAVANAASTGTTVNALAKLTGAPSTAVIATTSDTTGLLGVVTGGAGTSGSAQITVQGHASCIFDGATTAGHYVQASTATGGDCHDAGATYPTSGQVLGRVLSTNGSGGTYALVMFPPEQRWFATTAQTVSIVSSSSHTGGFSANGSGTYTVPAGVKAVVLRLAGGSGGGGGSGTSPGAATAGGNTCLAASGSACTSPLYEAGGGAFGSAGNGTAAAGGTISGSSACDIAIAGQNGGTSLGIAAIFGGAGGNNAFFGGGGPGGYGYSGGEGAGTAAAANTGGGGGGAGAGSTAGNGGGGGAGAACEVLIASPASTYTYAIGAAGAAGTAGTGGAAGGAGSGGSIIAREYY